MPKRALTAMLAIAMLAAIVPTANAASPPRIVKASSLTAQRIDRGTHDYYSLGAIVRFDRSLTSAERKLALIATPWAFRSHLAAGQAVPDALFGGTSLGRIGAKARHCYLAEVASLHAWHSVRAGRSWRLALHDGHTVLRTAPRVVLRVATSAAEHQQARRLGCY